MRIRTTLLVLGLILLFGGLGRFFYAQHRTKEKVQLQLQQLDQVLAADNDKAAYAAEGTLKGLEAQVKKNQNQPEDLALFGRAEAFALRADSLVQTLRNRHRRLLHAGTNSVADAAHDSLSRQLASYERYRQQLCPAGSAQLLPVDFRNLPLAAALARLTRLESDIRTTEIATLQLLGSQLGARRFSGHLEAVATAEASTVAPGSVYRAKLYLAKPLAGLCASMTCNGQPVRVAPNGQGLVRFTAPRRPGPAAWVGAVHIRQNGRDSTFQVRVPYRVMRR